MTKNPKKAFVLDTSVLIHDPEAILNFQEHDVFIPLEVINELDRIKTEGSERGAAARGVQRNLLLYLPKIGSAQGELPTGGKIGVLIPPPAVLNRQSETGILLGEMDTPDHKIIATAVWLRSKNEQKVTLVSKDMGMVLKARTACLETEDYRFDKAPEPDQDCEEIELTNSEMGKFSAEGILELPEDRIPNLDLNAYGLFHANKKTPWRYAGFGRFLSVNSGSVRVPNGIEIQARNLEQLFLLDALLNPAIHLVTVAGRAGTGKTLLTMAAALQLIGAKNYTGVCITKPNEPIGRENGFLPGTIEEKMRPWLQPYADALNFLHRRGAPQNKRQSDRKAQTKNADPKEKSNTRRPYDILTEAGIVEITALEHIRGRSIPNRIFVVDESQNTRPAMTKTITSRIAEGSKLIYLGDLEQIDNPYLDRFSNGLAHVRSKMRNLANAAHLTLKKGERSLLAEQAAKLL